MKKLFFLFFLGMILSLSGCAAIQKQNNINKQMENFVFNAAPDKVYAAADRVLSSIFVQIKPTGKNRGASDWTITESSLGGQPKKDKVRWAIVVTAKGHNKSILRIYKESSSNLSGSWSKVFKQRHLVYEYNTLQRIYPAEAARIDRLASMQK